MNIEKITRVLTWGFLLFIFIGIINLFCIPKSYELNFPFIAIGICIGILICVINEDKYIQSNTTVTHDSESEPEIQPIKGVPNPGKSSMICPKCQSMVQLKCNNCGTYSCSHCFGTRCPVCSIGILEQFTK